MPEIVEVKYEKEHINKVVNNVPFYLGNFSKCGRVDNKMKNFIDGIKNGKLFKNSYYLNAKSRGKELLLELKNGNNEKLLLFCFGLGMTGTWKYSNVKDIDFKHVRFYFYDNNGNYLYLHDPRRFARFKIGEFDNMKSPDIINNYGCFVSWLSLIQKNKYLNKPICDVILDQHLFNGIGAYMASEIIGRANLNPLLTINEIKRQNKIEEFCTFIYYIAKKSYDLGGGQIKNWVNPLLGNSNEKKKEFQEWLRFYGNKENTIKLLVEGDRWLWIDKKWKDYLLINNRKIK